MEAYLVVMIVILLIGTGILFVRLLRYRRQIHHMLNELRMLEQSESRILLTSVTNIGRTEEMIAAVNSLMEKNRCRLEQLIRENRTYRESITSISHDIRTPLTSAKGYIQMLRGQAEEMKKEEYLKIVERRLNDLTGLLDQLFLYARIEAGELSLHMETFNAGNVFAETISMFYEDFVEKSCEPKIDLCPEPCWLCADRQAFVRILENIIKNALFHGIGDYALSLRQKGQYAVIRVSNKTESISVEDLECIFDRFYTTDRSRSRKATGLGLSIVKELTEQMHGEAVAVLENDVFSIEVQFPIQEK